MKMRIFDLKESTNTFIKRRNFEETNFYEEISSFVDTIKNKYYLKPNLAAAS